MRILVIDDDPSITTMVNECIAGAERLAGLEFVYAESDDAALSALDAGPPFSMALVTVDGRAVSGLSLFRRLLDRTVRIPRIGLSNGRDMLQVKRAIGDGAADILIKPLASADVVETVERVTHQVERRRQNWRERSAYMALRREVDIAADMQRRILPQRFPDCVGLEVATIMRPARGVGGDFYDVFAIDDERVGILIADVSGKGIPAAFYMAVASTTMRSVAMAAATPGRCLTEVNEILVARDIPGMFVSLFYAVVNTADWTVCCANAGHSPALVCSARTGNLDTFVSAGGTVLGIIGGETYGESSFSLAPGDSVFLYTDGVTEAYNEKREQFGDARLRSIIHAGAAADCKALIERLDGALTHFARDADQHDDITALALRRVPS